MLQLIWTAKMALPGYPRRIASGPEHRFPDHLPNASWSIATTVHELKNLLEPPARWLDVVCNPVNHRAHLGPKRLASRNIILRPCAGALPASDFIIVFGTVAEGR